LRWSTAADVLALIGLSNAVEVTLAITVITPA
jgi:hypothetical protein